MRWPRYGQMKPSGVAWLGDVPGHWDVKRIKHTIVSLANGLWGDEPDGGEEDISVVRVADFDRVRLRTREQIPTSRRIPRSDQVSRLLTEGDLLIEKSGGGDQQSVGVVVRFVGAGPAVSSNFVARMRVADECEGAFLVYLHHALYVGRVNQRSIKQTTGIQNLDAGSYLSELIAMPPLNEQQIVAAFLDRETARIDALVAAKRRLIALLQEKRTALIARAVTRGLDPDAPTKDSGVTWLGRVPAHWEVGHLRRFASITDCKHYTVTFADDGLPVASVGELSGNRFSLKNAKRTTPGEYEFLRAGRVPRRGALLYCRNASVGLVGHIDTDEPFALGQDVCLIDAQDTDGRYLYYQLISRAVTAQLESKMVGATFNRINVADIKEFAIAWPPPPEQATISRMLDGATAALGRQERLAYLTIERLDEYRSTLISSAVTGRIDVRAAA